jgi:hypothetical protein
MLKVYRRLLVVVSVATALFATFALRVSAQPFAAMGAINHPNSAVTRVHGFHCRSELGWDARVGVHHYHRHDGICKDYKPCVGEQRRCSMILGRGWDSWQFERWGFDNWRYTDCMMRNGCY